MFKLYNYIFLVLKENILIVSLIIYICTITIMVISLNQKDKKIENIKSLLQKQKLEIQSIIYANEIKILESNKELLKRNKLQLDSLVSVKDSIYLQQQIKTKNELIKLKKQTDSLTWFVNNITPEQRKAERIKWWSNK